MKIIRKEPETLCIPLIASLLEISPTTVKRYLKSGKLKGQTIRDLIEFAEERAKKVQLIALKYSQNKKPGN
jgi:predicted transcriptional regulator